MGPFLSAVHLLLALVVPVSVGLCLCASRVASFSAARCFVVVVVFSSLRTSGCICNGPVVIPLVWRVVVDWLLSSLRSLATK